MKNKSDYKLGKTCAKCTALIKDKNTTGLCLYHLRSRTKSLLPMVCLVCGKHEYPKPSKRKEYKTCSLKCRSILKTKTYTIPRPEITEYSGQIKVINGNIIVNSELYEWLNQYKWHISDTGYAVLRQMVNGKKKTIRMHRFIMQPPVHLVIDHINRNPLDNRVSNLRICTQTENMNNREAVENAKLYYFSKSRNRWIVDASRYDVHHRQFRTEEAAKALVNQLKTGGNN